MAKNPGLRGSKLTGGDEEKAKGRPMKNAQNRAEITRNEQSRRPMGQGSWK